MRKTNTALKLVPIRNPLEEYKEVVASIKALEASKDALRTEIIGLMDLEASDSVNVGTFKAERKTVDQFRIDTKKAKEILGERFPEITSIVSQTRLTVV